MNRLCKIRDIQRAVHQYEEAFMQMYGICLNEGMLLCSLCRKETEESISSLSSGELSRMLGLTPSNTSKVISSLEKKGYVRREIGEGDKRQMFFGMTDSGREILSRIRKDELELPELLRPIEK